MEAVLLTACWFEQQREAHMENEQYNETIS